MNVYSSSEKRSQLVHTEFLADNFDIKEVMGIDSKYVCSIAGIELWITKSPCTHYINLQLRNKDKLIYLTRSLDFKFIQTIILSLVKAKSITKDVLNYLGFLSGLDVYNLVKPYLDLKYKESCYG